MGKLGEILLKELSVLRPFGCISTKYNKYWGMKKEKSGFNPVRRVVTNAFLSVAIPTYVMFTLGVGANSLKPQYFIRDVERKNMRVEQEARDYSKKRFYEADKNGDLVLDVNEFYDYTHGGRE